MTSIKDIFEKFEKSVDTNHAYDKWKQLKSSIQKEFEQLDKPNKGLILAVQLLKDKLKEKDKELNSEIPSIRKTFNEIRKHTDRIIKERDKANFRNHELFIKNSVLITKLKQKDKEWTDKINEIKKEIKIIEDYGYDKIITIRRLEVIKSLIESEETVSNISANPKFDIRDSSENPKRGKKVDK